MASQPQSRVRLRPLLGPLVAAAFASLVACLPARGSPEPEAAPHTDVRRQVVSEFHFNPPAAAAQDTSPVLAAGVAAKPPVEPVDPNLVRMEAYTVRDSVKMSALTEQFLQQKKQALTDHEMKQLGIGLHTQSVGPLHLYAATLFYIPFAAGVGVSW